MNSRDLDSKLFFRASDGANGYELYTSEGTSSTTSMVKNIGTGSHSGFVEPWFANLASDMGIMKVGNRAVFIGLDAPDALGGNGSELWSSDGTASGTFMLGNISKGNDGVHGFTPFAHTPIMPCGSTVLCPDFLVLDDILYFVFDDNGTIGRELWRTDGTPSGTFLIKDFTPGTFTAMHSGSLQAHHGITSPRPLYEAGGELYVAASESTTYLDEELWHISGRAQPEAKMMFNINANSSHSQILLPTFVNGHLVFSAKSNFDGIRLFSISTNVEFLVS